MASKKFKINCIEEGIMENIICKGAEIDVEDVWAMKNENLRLSNGKPYCVLVISEELATISKEAKLVVASREYVQNTMAKALLANSLGQKLIVNFYLKFNKPVMETNVFYDREDAIAWLREKIRSKQLA